LGGAVGGVLGGGRSTEQSDDDQRPSRFDVTVTNFGNVPADDVVVTPRVGDRTLPRQAVPSLAPGESATVTVDLSTVRRPGTVEFAVDYRAAGETSEGVVGYDYRPPTGQITLTGVDLAFENGRLQITGNAGNTGDAPVQGVVVAVGDGPAVTPAYPQRTYFVGTVDGSEFAPFELTAGVDRENVSAIPVRVQYTTDGVTVNRTVDVPYDDSLEPGDDGGPPLLLYAGGVVALVLVAVGVFVFARRSRGESESESG
jgi:CARDB.